MSVLSIGSGRGAGRKSARSLAGKRWEATFKTSLETMLDPFVILTPVRDVRRAHRGLRLCLRRILRWARTPTWIVKRSLGADCSSVRPAHRSSGLFEMYCHTLDSGEPLVLDGFCYEDELGRRAESAVARHPCQQARRRTRLYLA